MNGMMKRALTIALTFSLIGTFTTVQQVYGETASKDSVSENTVQNGSVSDNTVSDNTVSKNTVSQNNLSAQKPALLADTALDSIFPTSKAELDTAVANGQYKDHTFYVTKKDDLLALQMLSQDFDFVTVNGENKVQWSIAFQQMVNGVGTTSTEWTLPAGFTGLGTETSPFKGKIYSYLDGMSYRLTSPLIAYAAPEAVMERMAITANISEGSGTASTAMISRYLIRTKTEERAAMSFSGVTLYGYASNESGNAAVLYGEVINTAPDAMELDSSVSGIIMNGLTVTGKYAGSIAGTVTGTVNLKAAELLTFAQVAVKGSSGAPANGAASVYEANGAAGVIAGFLRADGSGNKPVLILDATTPRTYTVQVLGTGMNGGLVGAIENGTLQIDGTQTLTMTGSVAGSTAGALAGYLGNTEGSIKNINSSVAVNVNGGSLYAGGLIGHYYQTAATGTSYTVFEKLNMSGNTDSTGSAGGVIGFLEADRIRLGNPAAAAADLTVGGSISGTVSAGGVVGQASGRYLEFSNCTVSAVCSRGASVGKILGRGRENAVIKIQNASVSGAITPAGGSASSGGLVGELESGSLCALDGTIDADGVSISSAVTKTGHLIGAQTESLVYKEESCNYTRPSGKAWVDDIGTYGGVYLNGTWGEGTELISYENAKVNGTVGSASPYTLDSEADVIRLAIALNTEGKFASDCFGGLDKTVLLDADYNITKDLNLTGSGIYCLNRNDTTGRGQAFTGSFGGTGKVTLTFQNMADANDQLETYQSDLSLFPRVKDAVFKNMTLQRRIAYAKTAAAGIACYAEDTVTVDNVDAQAELTGSRDGSQYRYGGLFAQYSTANGAAFTVTDTTLSGGITIAGGGQHYAGGLVAVYDQSGSTPSTVAIDGLTIANTISSNSGLVSSMMTQVNGGSTDYTTDKTILSMKNITVKNNAALTISASGVTGGFLGREWKNVAPDTASNYSVLNLTVGDGGAAADGPKYSSNGYFGGMVHTVTGRIQLKNTSIQNGTFHAANSGSESNGLLFYNGLNALIEIEDYSIAGHEMNPSGDVTAEAGTKVAVTGATKGFDEIVGDNIGNSWTERNANSYQTGGIVNIINPGFRDMTASSYTSYRNRFLSIDGPASTYTRYYYNLFGESLSGEAAFLAGKQLNSTAPVITDGDQMMVWHLSHYMNDSVRRYLAPYYTAGVQNRNLNTTFSGMIDLNGKSYYPTFVTGGTYTGTANAEIRFYGQEISTGEKAAAGGNKNPGLSTRQHYMMHAGLFDSPWGNITVQGGADFLTLSGSVSNIGGNSGGLFVRSISGAKQIYHVRLNGLYIADFIAATHATGLLIGIVNDGTTLDLSYIETMGYESFIGGGKKAASALIGRAGSVDNSNMSSTQNLNIDFTNMRVSDRTTGIFGYASYIDQYFYTDDASLNKGHGRYLFTKNAFDGTAANVEDSGTTEFAPFIAGSPYGNNTYDKSYVTIGQELAGGVEYWDVNTTAPLGPVDGTSYPLPDTNKNNTTSTYSFTWSAANITANYIPYIGNAHAASKDIQVNPKNANLIEGCGTYEDPYVITKPGQLLALSIYIGLADGADDRYLDKWKINQIGSDAAFCEGTAHTAVEYQYTGTGNGNTAFPTKDQLRCAYYEIAADIDLTALSSATDKQIAQDFYGLGTEQYPFSGVIIGKDGTTPTITLPLKKTNNTVSTFGLIAYAKGAVVKDIKITGNRTQTDTSLTDIVKVSEAAGSAMAVVLGGDNIIDNVVVTNRVALASASVIAGGIAGWIGPRAGNNAEEYRFSGCTVTGKTTVCSRLASSGGMIGGITQIQDQSSSFNNLTINFTDCQIAGTDASENAVKIEALRAGTTAVGDDNNVSNQQRMGVGRAGGFVGYCGRRNNGNGISSVEIKAGITAKTTMGVKNAVISGAYCAGGLVGEQFSQSGGSKLTVKNALIEDSVLTGMKYNADNTNCVFGVGGIIGKFDEDSNASAVDIADIKLVRTEVSNAYADTTYYGLSCGGIAGFLRADTGNFTNIEIGETTGTPYETVLTKKANAGGVIGTAAGGNGRAVTMKNIKLDHIIVEADNRSTSDKTAGKLAGRPVDYVTRAGGYVGSLACTLTIEKPDGAYNTVQNCRIATVSNSAGGIVGAKETAGKLTVRGVLAENNEIGQNAALESTRAIGNGGLVGKLSGAAYLEDTQVKNNRVYGNNAGGICGYTNKDSGNLEIGSTTGLVEVKDNAMLGCNVGGIVGLNAGVMLNVLDTVVENNAMLAYRSAASNSMAAAGGAIGRQDSSDSNAGFYLDQIQIKGNKILSRSENSRLSVAAGGLIGYTALYGKSYYAYEPVLQNNQIGLYHTTAYDGKLLADTALRSDILDCLSGESAKSGITSADIRAALLYWGLAGEFTGEPSAAESIPTDLTEEKLYAYATGIGSFVGRQDSTGNLYVLAPDVSYTDTYTGSVQPVIDVGSAVKDKSSPQTLLSAPYEYRKNIHVIYYHMDTSAGNTAAARWTDKDMLFSQINLDSTFAEYKQALEDSTNQQWKKTLAAYRLGVTTELTDETKKQLTYSDLYEKAYRDAAGNYVSPLYNSASKSEATKLPLLVMDTQYGAIDTQLSAVLSALTGVGGGHSAGSETLYNSGMAAVTNITVQGKSIQGGVISNASAAPSISAAKNNGKWELTYQGFDKEETAAVPGTFSLVTVTYSWKHTQAGKSSEETFSRTIQLPVFVLERLTIDTHTKIAEGFVYSADKAKKDGLDSNVVMASDSSYTMYTEFIYGAARSKYEQSIDKVFSMHYVENGEDRSYTFLDGTRLTLLDVNDQNKPYYYTVTGSTTNAIKYSDFKDADGNSYVNKKLNATTGYEVHEGADTFVTVADGVTYTYEDVAVEKFLMLVDISKAVGGGSETSASTFEVSPQIGEDLIRNTTLTEHSNLGVIKLPGLTISLADKGTNTEIDGTIAKDGSLITDANISVSASQPYWNAVIANRNNTIDSANHNKYLELQVYLTDGVNQVALPDNTNVSILGDRTNPALLNGENAADIKIPSTNLGAYVDASQIYFYKDYKDKAAGTIQFPLDALTSMMQKEAEAGYIYGTVNWQQQIQINFASADLNGYDAASYDVNLELLRISDPDYPSGGTTVDSYKKTCSAKQQENLSCALTADDLMELGINTYQNETPLPHVIHGTFVLDFEQLLGTGDVNSASIASKYYTVTYRIFKKAPKTGGGYEYIPYTGTNISLSLADGTPLLQSASGMEDGKAFSYQYATYQFTESELKNGTDKEGAAGDKGVITRKLNLTVGDAINDTDDLTNYKLVATVKVSDAAPSPAEMDGLINADMNDFFIFTVAKLKTDLDY